MFQFGTASRFSLLTWKLVIRYLAAAGVERGSAGLDICSRPCGTALARTGRFDILQNLDAVFQRKMLNDISDQEEVRIRQLILDEIQIHVPRILQVLVLLRVVQDDLCDDVNPSIVEVCKAIERGLPVAVAGRRVDHRVQPVLLHRIVDELAHSRRVFERAALPAVALRATPLVRVVDVLDCKAADLFLVDVISFQ